jgi:hypothetical protein
MVPDGEDCEINSVLDGCVTDVFCVRTNESWTIQSIGVDGGSGC